MPWLRLATTLALALLSLGFALWLWRRVARLGHLPVRRIFLVLAGGAVLAAIGAVVERWVLGWAGLSFEAKQGQTLGPLLAMVLFASPLEEALKTAAVWPLYVGRKFSTGQVGATYAAVAAGGFAAAETVLLFVLWGHTSWLDILRAAFALPAHFFFAGVWGFMLGGGRRDRYFGIIWILCAVLHGVYDHIVFGRGPGLLVVVVPMLIMMAVGVFGLLRGGEHKRSSTVSLFDPPSVGAVREVMSGGGRPLMLHWIAAGALVTLGVMLAFLGAAVYLGHQLEVDFALADGASIEGALPIALLGGALLAAFPFSAYLVARASGAISVLEPAWSTGAAIVVVLALFSVTEPTALVIALGIAPVGFALACAGAWFGLERH